MLPADGAHLAASISFLTSLSVTRLSVKALMLLRVLIALKTSNLLCSGFYTILTAVSIVIPRSVMLNGISLGS